jgi:hypothetical protein
MADQLFHRRSAKRADELRREAQKREPYDVVLIVCEGGKTEPQYLQEIRDAFKLSTANIREWPFLCPQRKTSGCHGACQPVGETYRGVG